MKCYGPLTPLITRSQALDLVKSAKGRKEVLEEALEELTFAINLRDQVARYYFVRYGAAFNHHCVCNHLNLK